MNSTFRADRQRRETRRCTDFFGKKLIERNVAVRTVLSLGIENTGKKAMNSEVSTLDTMVQSSKDRELVAILPEWFQQGGFLVIRTGGLGEQLLNLKAEEIANRHEALRIVVRTIHRSQCGVSLHGTH